ncbi:MAG TPA: class I SAM-dependent methyltransferase [Bacteroides sp.]|nr:class I SAM-dependent methyltransferase [Bacteroides sp.]
MNEYYLIKDKCREGLTRYLENACSKIPKTDSKQMLDLGCGTGVPTLWLADHFSGTITAIDTDRKALGFLQQKIEIRHLQQRAKTHHISFFDFTFEPGFFDLILAEGFLNTVGFETGFRRAVDSLKKGGYFIIHDEYRDHEKKSAFIGKNSCQITNTLYLDASVWWNDYYRQLESEINDPKNAGIRALFENDLKEIESYRADPSLFRSMYYILKKL